MQSPTIPTTTTSTTPSPPPPLLYAQITISEYLRCEHILHLENIYKITIPITYFNIASIGILFSFVLLGCCYLYKLFSHKQICTCKLCRGNYKIISHLNEGGFGEIYKVLHKNTYYILKKCKTENISEADDLLIEAKHLRVLSHKNIVKYHDDFIHIEYIKGKIEPLVYVIIIMEYCEGGDLKELIDKRFYANEPFSNEEIIHILIQLCEGLSYIHHKNIIHRDIKSQNIFFTKDGILRIGDFGLARKIKKNRKLNTSMTKVGTDCYMAPEVMRNRRYGSPADVWSFGCVVEELLTLTFVWQYENIIAVEAMMNKNFIDLYLNDINCDKYNYTMFKEMLRKIFVFEPEKRDSIDTILYKLHKERKKIQNLKATITLNKHY